MTDQLIVGLIVGWVANTVWYDFIVPVFTNAWHDVRNTKCTGECNQGRNCTCKEK